MAGLFETEAKVLKTSWLDRDTGEEIDGGFTDIVIDPDDLPYIPPIEPINN